MSGIALPRSEPTRWCIAGVDHLRLCRIQMSEGSPKGPAHFLHTQPLSGNRHPYIAFDLRLSNFTNSSPLLPSSHLDISPPQAHLAIDWASTMSLGPGLPMILTSASTLRAKATPESWKGRRRSGDRGINGGRTSKDPYINLMSSSGMQLLFVYEQLRW